MEEQSKKRNDRLLPSFFAWFDLHYFCRLFFIATPAVRSVRKGLDLTLTRLTTGAFLEQQRAREKAAKGETHGARQNGNIAEPFFADAQPSPSTTAKKGDNASMTNNATSDTSSHHSSEIDVDEVLQRMERNGATVSQHTFLSAVSAGSCKPPSSCLSAVHPQAHCSPLLTLSHQQPNCCRRRTSRPQRKGRRVGEKAAEESACSPFLPPSPRRCSPQTKKTLSTSRTATVRNITDSRGERAAPRQA